MANNHVPSGWDSVGTVILSFHNRSKSDTIGCKNYWISSGPCSFGPGRMLVHNKFDVQYLENKRAVQETQ